MSRLDRAIEACRDAAAAAGEMSVNEIDQDSDFVDDLGFDNLELLGLSLIIEEIFSIQCPDDLFAYPRRRCPSGLADWAIKQSELASWTEARAGGRRRA